MEKTKSTENLELKIDEEVKWEGKPGTFKLIEKSNKQALLTRWIITAVAAIVIIVLYCIVVQNDERLNFNMILPSITVIIAAFIIVRPIVDYYSLKRKCTYFATNERLIVVIGFDSVISMPLEDVDSVKFINKENGRTDILFGKYAVKRPYSKIRIIALRPKEDFVGGETKVIGMAFYDVQDAEKIRKILLPGTDVTAQNI